jgi:sterol desaturase/sphingolipid hydroxylase (fatty acid hydroxylase superfamily)
MSSAALVAWEATIRFTAFVAVLAVLALAERARPCRHDARPAWRQAVNVMLAIVDSLLLRLLLPLVGIAFAARMRAAGVGLFAAVAWPEPLEIAAAALALDCLIYFQHRVMHGVPLLWRAHRVHHSDLAFDVTLGVRFHPFEIALSQGVKFAAIAALGAAPLAVLIFEVVLQSGALFTHADFAFPPGAERRLRWLVVTPSLHRVHHSVARDETDSNFGFSAVWWDRLFGTYRAAPRLPETSVPVGVPEFRAPDALGLAALLRQPFISPQRPPSPARERVEASRAR